VPHNISPGRDLNPQYLVYETSALPD